MRVSWGHFPPTSTGSRNAPSLRRRLARLLFERTEFGLEPAFGNEGRHHRAEDIRPKFAPGRLPPRANHEGGPILFACPSYGLATPTRLYQCRRCALPVQLSRNRLRSC
jgi:hypothetical protein